MPTIYPHRAPGLLPTCRDNGLPKTENAYKNLLEVLNRARRAGLVAFDDIRDDGVTVIEPDGFDDMSDFWRVVSAWATS